MQFLWVCDKYHKRAGGGLILGRTEIILWKLAETRIRGDLILLLGLSSCPTDVCNPRKYTKKILSWKLLLLQWCQVAKCYWPSCPQYRENKIWYIAAKKCPSSCHFFFWLGGAFVISFSRASLTLILFPGVWIRKETEIGLISWPN